MFDSSQQRSFLSVIAENTPTREKKKLYVYLNIERLRHFYCSESRVLDDVCSYFEHQNGKIQYKDFCKKLQQYVEESRKDNETRNDNQVIKKRQKSVSRSPRQRKANWQELPEPETSEIDVTKRTIRVDERLESQRLLRVLYILFLCIQISNHFSNYRKVFEGSLKRAFLELK